MNLRVPPRHDIPILVREADWAQLVSEHRLRCGRCARVDSETVFRYDYDDWQWVCDVCDLVQRLEGGTDVDVGC